MPLEQLCLRIKILGYPGSIKGVLNKLVEPPDSDAIDASISILVDLQALKVGTGRKGGPRSHHGGDCTELEELTALGHHLARLPLITMHD